MLAEKELSSPGQLQNGEPPSTARSAPASSSSLGSSSGVALSQKRSKVRLASSLFFHTLFYFFRLVCSSSSPPSSLFLQTIERTTSSGTDQPASSPVSTSHPLGSGTGAEHSPSSSKVWLLCPPLSSSLHPPLFPSPPGALFLCVPSHMSASFPPPTLLLLLIYICFFSSTSLTDLT